MELRLSDRSSSSAKQEYRLVPEGRRLAAQRTRRRRPVARPRAWTRPRCPQFIEALEKSGLLYRAGRERPKDHDGPRVPRQRFSAVLGSWLSEAFAHPFWERMMSGKGSARLFTGWLIELYHYTKNANRHMPLSCAYAPREADQAAARQALRRGVEPLPLLHEVAEGAGLHRAADRRVGAAADDAGALELHAPGRARGHPRVLDLLGGARGHDDRPQDVQPVLREVGRALRHPEGGDRAHLRAPRSRRAVPALGSLPRDPRDGPGDVGASARRASSTTATSSSSTSGFGPTTSRSTTRSNRTRCRGARSTSLLD